MLEKHDYIGGFTFNLSKLINGMNQEIIGELEGGTCSNGAKIKIMGSEIKEDYDVNVMTFQVEA